MTNAVSTQACQKCGQHPGRSYAYYYGSYSGFRSGETGSSVVSVTTYKIEGNRSVVLCKKCVQQDWASRLVKPLTRFLMFFGIAAILALGGIAVFLNRESLAVQSEFAKWFSEAFPALCLIGVIVLFYFFLKHFIKTLGILFERSDTRGEYAAIGFEKADQKFPYFWVWKGYKNNDKPSVIK